MVQSYEYKILWTSGIVWSDTSDKEEKTWLETQVKLSEITTETNKNPKNKTNPTTSTTQPIQFLFKETKNQYGLIKNF